jgi:hypothetical protein
LNLYEDEAVGGGIGYRIGVNYICDGLRRRTILTKQN